MKSDEIIEKIRKKLIESDPANRSVTCIIQFNFTDTQGQLIKNVVFDFKALQIYDGTSSEADGQITVSDDDFYLIGTHKTTFEDMLAKEKVIIIGSEDAVNKMFDKFRMNSKK